jgi:hypothetical protein
MPNLVVSRVPTLKPDYNSMAWVCTLESLRKFSIIFLLPNQVILPDYNPKL